MNSSCITSPAASVPSSAEMNGSGATVTATATAPQVTIPRNGGSNANNLPSSSTAAAAAAAADANAMPPPPPTTPGGLMRTAGAAAAASAAQSSASASVSSNANNISSVNISAGATSAVSVVPRAPITVPKTAYPTATAAAASSSIRGTTRTSLGTPSPLAKLPPMGISAATSKITMVARPLVQQQRVGLAGNTAQVMVKKSTPIIVPSPVLSTPTRAPQQTRPAVPQPVLSSALSASITAKITTRLTSAVMGGQQQRVIPKYLAKAPAPQLYRTTASTVPATKPLVANGRLGVGVGVVKPTMASTSIIKQPILSSIPTPSPATSAALQHHRPTPVPSSVISHVVSHLQPMGVAPAGMPPPPPPDNTPGSSGGNSPKKKSGHPLRRGKWTSEEEAYANRLINEFKSGLLPLTDGTTLRNFLSKLLNCDPMRISKKFVGNNCIGKQVFRRRVADINRLAPDQIQQMRVEVSELERRFFDRVAQTNRVKSPGVSTTMTTGHTMTVPANTTINIINVGGGKIREEMELDRPPTPPWLRPPSTYKPKGKFAEKFMAAKAASAAVTPPPTAVVVPPTGAPQHLHPKVSVSSTPPLVDVKPDVEKAFEAILRSGSSLDCLAQAAADGGIPRTESALEQLARTASAAKFVEDIVNGDSSLGESCSSGNRLSQSSLKGSFEALMSMDIHSVENLVELAASSNSTAILSELTKSYSDATRNHGQSSANMSSRMESFIKSLSSANLFKSGLDSQQALGSLLNAHASRGSLLNAYPSTNIFDAERFSKRIESSTGFSQLRAEDGLANGAHNSVDDFLSLVASGDIPHQDPNLLKVPLQKVMQQGGIPPSSNGTKRKLSQQQLVALASRLAGSATNLPEMTCGGSALKKRKKK